MAKGKDTRYFSKTINGELVTMSATSQSDVVRYVYDGWRDITDEVADAQAAAKEIAAATPKPATPAASGAAK